MQTEILFKEEVLSPFLQAAHERGIARGKKYLVSEAELLESVIEADKYKLYEKFNFTHLTPYCIKYYGLSDDVAGYFVRVARKSVQVPALQHAIMEGLSVSKAKVIASVITPANQETWINKAQNSSKYELEQEVAQISAAPKKPERAKACGPDRFRIEFELNAEQHAHEMRAQELVSRKLGRFATLAEVQVFLLKGFLDREDPVRKADRAAKRATNREPDRAAKLATNREATSNNCKQTDTSRDGRSADSVVPSNGLGNPDHSAKRRFNPSSCASDRRRKRPAQVEHAVHHRDRGRCRIRMQDGSLCGSTRFTHIHHRIPLADGGTDNLENLITLCSAHHRILHDREL